MNANEVRSRFWTGTHYYRPPTPTQAEWPSDFEHVKELGLRIVQVRVFWNCYERAEGRYAWDDLDRFMDQAGGAGLSVVHQITLENAPAYIFSVHEGYRVDLRGDRIWPIAHAAFYAGGWIPCFDHPTVMDRGLEFTSRLVERYKNHSAMEFWHAWNEPRCRPMGECACPHSVRSYRDWLREKFGVIDALNEKFGKFFADFNDVDVPRDISDYAEMYLWRQWGASRVNERVSAVVELVRKLDPKHAVISHVGLGSVQQSPLCDISDDASMANVADMYGTSFEVRFYPEPVRHSMPFLICDWMRHVTGGNFSIYELYPSHGRFDPEIPAHEFQQWLWSAVSCGSRALFLWQFKKERLGLETNDAGLVETDGSDNSTSLAAKEAFSVMNRLGDRIATWRVPKAKIAMVHDLQSSLLNNIATTRPRPFDGWFNFEAPLWGSPSGHPYNANVHGWYYLFWANNIPVDVVAMQNIDEVLTRYDVVVLPSLYIVGEALAKKLVQFVERGGKLIVDGPFAERDDNTWLQVVRPMKTIADRFGYRQGVQTLVNDWREAMTFDGGVSATAAYQRIAWATTSAKTIARWADGSSAVVTQAVGCGAVCAIGAMPGLSTLTANDAGWLTVVEKLVIEWAGVTSPWVTGKKPELGVTVRELVDDAGRTIRFFFRRWGGDGHLLKLSDAAWSAITGHIDKEAVPVDGSHVKAIVV